MEDKVYIKFKDPKRKLNVSSNWFQKAIGNVIVQIVSSFVPKANPDFEHLMDNVNYWKIEFNKTENATWREIGYDKDDISIIAMPFENNYGFWTDNELTLDDYKNFDSVHLSSTEFENDWENFQKKNIK